MQEMTATTTLTMKEMTATKHYLAMPLYTVQDCRASPSLSAMPLYTVQDHAIHAYTMGLIRNKREEREEEVGRGGATQKLPREASRLNSSPEELVARRAVHMCCLVP